jgi:type III secretion protein R
VSSEALGQPNLWMIAFALVAIVPFLFMALTAFVKISTVLQIVRGAIGAQSVPSNTVVLALAGSLTLLAMAPVGDRIVERFEPIVHASQRLEPATLLLRGAEAVREPLRDFLHANASARELKRFVDLARKARPASDRDRIKDTDMTVVIPAFVTTELLEAFSLGFALYLPFLVLDLVIANVLLALGMQALSPTQVSLPFKLLLFVSIDGWGLLAQALVTGYKIS